jgi:hypothetical protein
MPLALRLNDQLGVSGDRKHEVGFAIRVRRAVEAVLERQSDLETGVGLGEFRSRSQRIAKSKSSNPSLAAVHKHVKLMRSVPTRGSHEPNVIGDDVAEGRGRNVPEATQWFVEGVGALPFFDATKQVDDWFALKARYGRTADVLNVKERVRKYRLNCIALSFKERGPARVVIVDFDWLVGRQG